MSHAHQFEARRLPHWAIALDTPIMKVKELNINDYSMLDVATILNRSGNNPTALSKMILAFNKALESYVYGIEHALKNHNTTQLIDITRTLKTTIGNFSNKKPFELAQKLEDLSLANHLVEASMVLLTLKQQIYVLQFELIQFEQAFKGSHL